MGRAVKEVSIADVQKAISRLSSDDRSLLLLDLTSRQLEESGIHLDVVILYDVIRDALKARSIPSPPFVVFERGSEGKSNAKRLQKMSQILEWIDSTFPATDSLYRRKAFKFAIHFLFKWMESRSIPISMQSATDNILQIPGQIEKAFPGAAAGGILPMIMDRYISTVGI